MMVFGTAMVIFAMSYQVSITQHTALRKRHSVGMFLVAVLAEVVIGLYG